MLIPFLADPLSVPDQYIIIAGVIRCRLPEYYAVPETPVLLK